MKEEKRVNKFDPLPPNYDMLDYDSKIVATEAVYSRQSHSRFQFHRGDKELISSDRTKHIFIKEEE